MNSQYGIRRIESAINYLSQQKYRDYAGSADCAVSLYQWYVAIGNARTLLKAAKADILAQTDRSFGPSLPKSPIEKSIVSSIDIVDPSVDLLTPIATVVVIDAAKLEREVLKASIADADIQRLLPFQTRLVMGENHIHIENTSAYTVETQYHLISEGDTLCVKVGQTYALGAYRSVQVSKVATCPGCLAKAKGVIVNHLLNTPSIIRQ
jgi:hypothetical protein